MKNKYSNDILIKLLLSMCFFIITLAFIVARNSPATGYEVSIYRSTPIFVWISLIISIVCGILIIVYQVYNYGCEKNNLCIFSLILILICFIFSLSLFIIRGYYSWGLSLDTGTHVHYINQIIETGHIPSILFYPIMHLYVAEIIQILNLNLIILIKYIPLFIGFSYILFICALSKTVLAKNDQVLFVILANITFVSGWYLQLTANHMANLLFPLFLYIFIKCLIFRNIKWEILILIMVFLYPPFHPVPTLAILVFLLSFSYFSKVSGIFNKGIFPVGSLFKMKKTLVILLVVFLITWLSSFYVWESTIKNLNILITESSSISNLEKMESSIIYASSYQYNVIEQILKVYGSEILFIILGLLSVTIIYKDSNFKNDKKTLLLSLYGPFFALIFLVFLLSLSNLPFGPLRIIYYVVVLSTLFFGYLMFYLIEKAQSLKQTKLFKVICVFMTFLLILSYINGISTLYQSPYTLNISPHSTQTEIEGMSWMLDNRNLNLSIAAISVMKYRLGQVLLTPEEIKKHKVFKKNENKFKVPYHFGYTNDSNSTLSSYAREYYLVLAKRDYLMYTDIYPEIAEYRWYSSDFIKFNNDFSVDKIYSNSGFNIFYINVDLM